jgi:hypothetical protein
MSLLPQRKKSAEEIAKLRESLGIAGPPPAGEELPVETTVPVPAVAPVEPQVAPEISASVETASSPPLAPLPIAESHPAKAVRSLKRSERIPVLPIEESVPSPAAAETTGISAPVHHGPKQVRSLRKSEQLPIPAVQPPAPDSRLPIHRHSDQELNEIRRREALSNLAPPVHPQSLTAHLALIIPGYLSAVAGAVCYYFYELQISVTAGCVAVALLVAAFIYFKKPLSRHHAAFIGVISLFVIIFGALYYFPQLRHGT